MDTNTFVMETMGLRHVLGHLKQQFSICLHIQQNGGNMNMRIRDKGDVKMLN